MDEGFESILRTDSRNEKAAAIVAAVTQAFDSMWADFKRTHGFMFADEASENEAYMRVRRDVINSTVGFAETAVSMKDKDDVFIATFISGGILSAFNRAYDSVRHNNQNLKQSLNVIQQHQPGAFKSALANILHEKVFPNADKTALFEPMMP